jgi:hypothetical protein
MVIERKSMEQPEEVRTFDRGRMEIVWVGGTTVVRTTLEPGFRWSESLGPVVGAKRCQHSHLGYLSSGRLGVAPDGGDDVELEPGDVVSIEPGHDTWVVGSEPVVLLEFTGDDHLYKMLEWSGS